MCSQKKKIICVSLSECLYGKYNNKIDKEKLLNNALKKCVLKYVEWMIYVSIIYFYLLLQSQQHQNWIYK